MAKRRRGRGEGGVELLKSGSWRGVFCKIVDGKRVRASKTFKTKPEALAWVAQQQAAAHSPCAPPFSTISRTHRRNEIRYCFGVRLCTMLTLPLRY